MKDYLMLIISTVIFMQLSVSINRARIENATYMHQSRYFNLAIACAQELIDEAALQPFDDLNAFAYAHTDKAFMYKGDEYIVRVSVETIYRDDNGVFITEKNDMKRVEVIVSKAETPVYVKLAQIMVDEGV